MTPRLVAVAQAALDGEDIGMPTSDLIEDLMHEIVRLDRDNRNLEHHYKHHRDAGEEWYGRYEDVRDALREAADVWASHLNGMPNVRSRKRLDEIREQFRLDEEADNSVAAPKAEDEIVF